MTMAHEARAILLCNRLVRNTHSMRYYNNESPFFSLAWELTFRNNETMKYSKMIKTKIVGMIIFV